MMEQIDSQMAELPMWVQIWMNWMMGVFAASLFFIWKHREARWAVVSWMATMPLALGVFYLWGSVHLFGVVHFIAWAPLLVYLILRWRSGEAKFRGKGPFRIWSSLLMGTIGICLLFDIRDIALVAMGHKQ